MVLSCKISDHWAVKGDKTGLSVNGHQKTCNITVTYKDLGVFLNQGIMNLIKESRASIPATRTEHRLYFLVLEDGMEVLKTGFIFSCEVTLSVGNMRPEMNTETGSLNYFQSRLKIRFADRAGRRDNTDLVSLSESLRFYDRYFFDISYSLSYVSTSSTFTTLGSTIKILWLFYAHVKQSCSLVSLIILVSKDKII